MAAKKASEESKGKGASANNVNLKQKNSITKGNQVAPASGGDSNKNSNKGRR